ncbi:hypothetical protein HMPREF9445_00342 [Bacteroides clarus YIT 12056]|uniref:Uncharacterized protein n=1 Tax=Bacteroides clarus YIT 12056 TaxID=762984 RepID=A0ABN0CST1_9BACE|nr:hypothetical protein HMPREF9445_00342 [Bacteroides clarus YIT 12056]
MLSFCVGNNFFSLSFNSVDKFSSLGVNYCLNFATALFLLGYMQLPLQGIMSGPKHLE